MNEKMTFFSSYYKAIMKIKEPLERLKAFETICGYGITGEISEDLSEYDRVDMLFDMAKPVIDNNEKSRNGGSKGGKATGENTPSENILSPLAENSEAPLQKNNKPPCAKSASERERDIEKDIDNDKEQEKEKDGEEDKKPKRTQAALVGESSLSDPVKDKLMEWLAYKKERREGYKETGLKSLITQVEKHEQESGSTAVIDLINECMANGWKGIIWEKLKPTARNGTTGSVLDEWAAAGRRVMENERRRNDESFNGNTDFVGQFSGAE